jgi:predicted secreted Zn-dependent protease
VVLPKLAVKIRYADSIRYYGIRGRNPDQIADSIRANGPPGDHPAFPGHQDIMATTTPDYSPLRFRQRIADGSCRVTAVTGKAAYRVQLPRMIAPSRLPAGLLTWWTAMLEHTRWHEEQHILISQRWISTLKKRIVGKPCSQANRIIARWTRDLSAAQLAFDRTDANWRAPVYRGPWTWAG